ncbi:MAG: hypothetical protein RMK99_14145 [Anaerolineales bacterium]|nr:hypothetical protein [Anaerolineales bacterium]
MSALTLSLRALRHPVTLFSLGLLLLNDHVFKAAAPSALTGKLSDFAGLFFFPFLLTTLLSLLTDRRRIPARATFAASLAITAIGFTLIKTVPEANAAMRALLAGFRGGPVQIVLDPTDCMALVMLLPAAGLWRSLERASKPQRPGWGALLALSLAACATLATPPCPLPVRVEKLASDGINVYARLGSGHYWDTSPILRQSTDQGRSWGNAPGLTSEISSTLFSEVTYPVLACAPDDPTHCYRLPDQSRVEYSTDGGRTWQLAWELPWGRLQYMKRYHLIGSCKGIAGVDTRLNDVVLLSNNGQVTVIVAMGNEGVLVREPDGRWQRYGLGYGAEPTPFSAWSEGALALFFKPIWPEIAVLLILTLPVFLGASLGVWTTWSARTGRGKVVVVLGWILLSGVLLALGYFVAIAIQMRITEPRYLELALMLPMFFVAGSFLASPLTWLYAGVVVPALGLLWWRAAAQTPQPARAAQAGWACLALTLQLWLAGLPFVLWVFWVIPWYELALLSAVVLGIAVLRRGLRNIRARTQEALAV